MTSTALARRNRPTEADWSDFEKNLGISYDRWGTADIQRFWLLTSQLTEEGSAEYCIYHVDLNSASMSQVQSLSPILLWEFKIEYYAYSILGSKLYMIGGKDANFNFTNKVYLYDLGITLSSPSKTHCLEEAFIQPGPSMLAIKQRPFSVVIGDFRICAFSSELSNCNVPNFELFNANNSTWTRLPEPMSYDGLPPKHFVSITSYCIHESVLIISTSGEGVFGINLQIPCPKWFKLFASENVFKFPFDGRRGNWMWTWTMLENNYLCNSFYAVKREDLASYRYFFFETPKEIDSLVYSFQHGMCFGGANGDGCTNLCMVRVGFPYGKSTPNMLIHFLKPDAICKRGKLQSDRSFAFSLICSPSEWMYVDGCFPIKNKKKKKKKKKNRKNNGGK